MDQTLRLQALEKSLQLHSVWLKRGEISCSAELQIEDIIHVANIFYAYLKGDTK